MKAILMSINPKWVAKILNGKKTLEIRKTMPKCDLPIDVYIYCTKEDNLMKLSNFHNDKFVSGKEYDITNFVYLNSGYEGKGKVVAKFTLNEVEEIKWDYESPALSKYTTRDLNEWKLCIKSCLTGKEMIEYLGEENKGYAIHITNLEIFDKPKEISEFYNKLAPNFEHLVKYFEKRGEKYTRDDYDRYCEKVGYKLTRAPQNYCYIEI